MTDRLNALIVAIGVNIRAHLDDLRRQDGQAFVEYALVITLVAVAVALLTQWGLFTKAISDSLQKVMNALGNAGGP
jgi:Flp pilus assembly pilin Flp